MPSFLLSLFHSTLSNPQLCVAPTLFHFHSLFEVTWDCSECCCLWELIAQHRPAEIWAETGEAHADLEPQRWSAQACCSWQTFLGLLQAAGLLEWKCRSWSLAGNGWGDIFIISVLFIPFKSCFFLGYCYDPSLLSLCPHPLIKQNSQGSQRVFCAIKADPVIMSILQIFLEKK